MVYHCEINVKIKTQSNNKYCKKFNTKVQHCFSIVPVNWTAFHDQLKVAHCGAHHLCYVKETRGIWKNLTHCRILKDWSSVKVFYRFSLIWFSFPPGVGGAFTKRSSTEKRTAYCACTAYWINYRKIRQMAKYHTAAILEIIFCATQQLIFIWKDGVTTVSCMYKNYSSKLYLLVFFIFVTGLPYFCLLCFYNFRYIYMCVCLFYSLTVLLITWNYTDDELLKCWERLFLKWNVF